MWIHLCERITIFAAILFFMEKKLLVFNPDHDLALAHGTNHYVSPTSALAFADDCSAVLTWLIPDADVLVSDFPSPDFQNFCQKFPLNPHFVLKTDLSNTAIEKVVPWGWNHNLKSQLLKCGIPEDRLPSDAALSEIHRLSHRRTSVRAMTFLREHSRFASEFPVPASELVDEAAVAEFLSHYDAAIFKMPWSGSGRGLRRVLGAPTTHQAGWIRQSIRKYGCIMAEPFYDVVQDFAMEFWCDEKVTFSGYSYFNTQNGVYQSNLLYSDAEIERMLSEWVSTMVLEECCTLLTRFLQEEIAPYYHGCIGVDMFIYQKDNQYFINPCVEINLRMTMGYLANVFVKKYLAEGAKGFLRLRYVKEEGGLQSLADTYKKSFPLVVSDGKLVSGFLPLTPITEKTHYTVSVEVEV